MFLIINRNVIFIQFENQSKVKKKFDDFRNVLTYHKTEMNPLTPSDLLNAQFQGPFLNPHTDITYYNRLLLHVDESIEVQVTVLKDGGYAFFLFQHPSHPDLEFISVYPLGRRIISKDQFQEAMDKLEQVAKGWLL